MSKWAGVRYLRVALQQKGRGVIRLDLGSSDADGTSTGEGGQPDGSPEVMPDKLSEWLASSRHGDDGACPPRAPRHDIDADAASHWQGKTGTSGLMSSGRAQHGRLVQLAIGQPRRPHRSSTLMGTCLGIMLTSLRCIMHVMSSPQRPARPYTSLPRDLDHLAILPAQQLATSSADLTGDDRRWVLSRCERGADGGGVEVAGEVRMGGSGLECQC